MTSRTVVSEITHNDSKYPKLSLNNMNTHVDDVTVQFSQIGFFRVVCGPGTEMMTVSACAECQGHSVNPDYNSACVNCNGTAVANDNKTACGRI